MEIKQNAEDSITILLVANKIDMEHREVTTEEAQEFANAFNLLYKEVSLTKQDHHELVRCLLLIWETIVFSNIFLGFYVNFQLCEILASEVVKKIESGEINIDNHASGVRKGAPVSKAIFSITEHEKILIEENENELFTEHDTVDTLKAKMVDMNCEVKLLQEQNKDLLKKCYYYAIMSVKLYTTMIEDSSTNQINVQELVDSAIEQGIPDEELHEWIFKKLGWRWFINKHKVFSWL